jgi:hypothetical protein
VAGVKARLQLGQGLLERHVERLMVDFTAVWTALNRDRQLGGYRSRRSGDAELRACTCVDGVEEWQRCMICRG